MRTRTFIDKTNGSILVMTAPTVVDQPTLRLDYNAGLCIKMALVAAKDLRNIHYIFKGGSK